MSKNAFCFIALLGVLGGCATDDECDGAVLNCKWSELSERQEMEACDLITASIDAPAGTKYECTSGPNSGAYLTVESPATCVSHSYPTDCPVTVQQTLDCFKAAKANVCSAFDDSAACGRLLAAIGQCQ